MSRKPIIDLKLGESDFREIFEKKVAFFEGALHGLNYEWSDFSRDFHGINPVGGEVRFFQSERLSPPDYLVAIEENQNVIHEYKVEEIEERFRQGASLVVNRFDRYSVLGSRVCSDLAQISKNIVLGNAYVSKGRSRTFGSHWDRHCVFAVQVIGKKRWKVYRPTMELPLYNQPSTLHKSNGVDPDEKLELVVDRVLSPGDILYVPRGWWHETETVGAEPSMHISCGVHTLRLHDYLRWVLMSKADQKIELRRSVSSPEEFGKQINFALKVFAEECAKDENHQQYSLERESLYKRNKLVHFENFISENFRAEE
ncbi:MAG: cupin domain-containing protein [Roseateles sp.]|uniref:JmjC domain-containing protein n=1 Tax=Roseateles sp. TaxID=1971397 RepID=UPI0039E8CCB6